MPQVLRSRGTTIVEHGSNVQWTVEPYSTVALFTKVHSFFLSKNQCEWINSLALFTWKVYFFFSEKPVQLIDFTCTVYVNVNSNLFLKKIGLRWIKFTRTVISILFLIIFYLILLHAKKIMETVVLVKWILYVMKL